MGYFLGLDGGGTKTECVLMGRGREIISRSFSRPSNPSCIGVGAAAREIVRAAELALQEGGVAPNAVAVLCAGVAGWYDRFPRETRSSEAGRCASRCRLGRISLPRAFRGGDRQ